MRKKKTTTTTCMMILTTLMIEATEETGVRVMAELEDLG